MSPERVAEILGLSENTLQDWRWKRIGPVWKDTGKCVRYSEADLEQWIEQQTQRPIER